MPSSFSLFSRLCSSSSSSMRSFSSLSTRYFVNIRIPEKIPTIVTYSTFSVPHSLHHLPIRHLVPLPRQFPLGGGAFALNSSCGRASFSSSSWWNRPNRSADSSPCAGTMETREDTVMRIANGSNDGDRFRFDWKRFPFNNGLIRWILLSVGLVISGATFLLFISSDPVFAATKNDDLVDVVLLACGSFNPPTIMHLRMFELARDHLRKDGRYGTVEGVISPVHHGYGKKGLVSAEHRIVMLKLATKDTKWLSIDEWEAMQVQAWTRTVMVLRHVKDVKKKRVMLLCGADLLKTFAVPGVWKPEDMEEILSEYGVVVITRSGTDLSSLVEQLPLLSRHKDNIYIVTETMTNEISSTNIREALKNGQSVRYFVPDPTLEYIYQTGLYGSNENR